MSLSSLGFLPSRRRTAERLAAAALEALLNAIDAVDANTGGHVRRVAVYSLILADAIGLDLRQRRAVELVALFHDIGKIDEALFDIIHDTTSLTPVERRAIAKHPERGAQVLRPLAAFYPQLAAGVLAHHEHWDGTGYPHKLKGRRIPFEARLVMIADTFDALTHDRPYRGGRPVDAATEIILNGRGTQFDPELVDLFALPPIQRQFHEARVKAVRPKRGRRKLPVRTEPQAEVPITFRWRHPTLHRMHKPGR
ncbi:MAG: metal-dependent phosphohydrolase region [Gemmatimonadetes bacterium]|nr:metal-dependent phosphohydrolase region [Gemmatimonadota bacterium]